jgi:hypothetical protein
VWHICVMDTVVHICLIAHELLRKDASSGMPCEKCI